MEEVIMNRKAIKQSYRVEKREKKRMFRSAKHELRSEYRQEKSALKETRNSLLLEQQEASEESLTPLKAKMNGPKRSVLEEIGNAVTHGLGACFAVVALVLMLLHSETAAERVAAAIYGAGMVLLFLISCLYHSFRYGTKVKRIFRRFDYSSIYLLIGATFAPLLLSYVGGTLGLVLFIVQWVVIATGITFVCVFSPVKFRWLHFTLYFVVGWSGLMLLPSMWQNCLPLALWILGGGIVYSLGMIPFAIHTKVAHFVWHFFVIAGAIVQWVGIYLYVYVIP